MYRRVSNWDFYLLLGVWSIGRVLGQLLLTVGRSLRQGLCCSWIRSRQFHVARIFLAILVPERMDVAGLQGLSLSEPWILSRFPVYGPLG